MGALCCSFERNTTPLYEVKGMEHVETGLHCVSPKLRAQYQPLVAALEAADEWYPIYFNQFAPVTPWLKYRYVQKLSVPLRIVGYTHSDSKVHLHFIWKVGAAAKVEDILNKSMKIQTTFDLPKFHSRAMRAEFILVWSSDRHQKWNSAGSISATHRRQSCCPNFGRKWGQPESCSYDRYGGKM